jgi:hypothetical protein
MSLCHWSGDSHVVYWLVRKPPPQIRSAIVRLSYSLLSVRFHVCSVQFVNKCHFLSLESGAWYKIFKLRFEFRMMGCFLLAIAVSRAALGSTQPPIQWVPDALSLNIKRSGVKLTHSPPCSAEVKNVWSYTSIPLYVFMEWCIIEHRIYLHGVVLS